MATVQRNVQCSTEEQPYEQQHLCCVVAKDQNRDTLPERKQQASRQTDQGDSAHLKHQLYNA